MFCRMASVSYTHLDVYKRQQLAFDFLSDTHGGWENNDGAYGEFCFDAAARCIHLEFNERLEAKSNNEGANA